MRPCVLNLLIGMLYMVLIFRAPFSCVSDSSIYPLLLKNGVFNEKLALCTEARDSICLVCEICRRCVAINAVYS